MAKKKDMKKEGVYYFHSEFKKIPYDQAQGDVKNMLENGEEVRGTVVKGYASTPTVDRYNDVVEPEAFRETIIKNYKKNPIILFQHMSHRPIGKATFMSIDNKGLYIEALIVDEDIEPKIKAGILKTFSIGYIPQKVEFKDKNGVLLDMNKVEDRKKIWEGGTKRIIKKLDLVENSIVSVPANPDAVFEMSKSVKGYFDNLEKDEKTLSKLLNNQEIMNTKKNLLEEEEVKAKKKPQIGDTCTMEDGTDGEMMMDGEEMVCKPIKKKKDGEDVVENEEKPEDSSQPAVETDGDNKGDETSPEKTDEKGGEEEPKPEEPTVTEEAIEEPRAEEVPDGEDKELMTKIMTVEGAKVAIEAIKSLQSKVAELESVLKSIPSKQAMAYFEVSAKTPQGEKHSPSSEDAKMGFIDSMKKAAV